MIVSSGLFDLETWLSCQPLLLVSAANKQRLLSVTKRRGRDETGLLATELLFVGIIFGTLRCTVESIRTGSKYSLIRMY